MLLLCKSLVPHLLTQNAITLIHPTASSYHMYICASSSHGYAPFFKGIIEQNFRNLNMDYDLFVIKFKNLKTWRVFEYVLVLTSVVRPDTFYLNCPFKGLRGNGFYFNFRATAHWTHLAQEGRSASVTFASTASAPDLGVLAVAGECHAPQTANARPTFASTACVPAMQALAQLVQRTTIVHQTFVHPECAKMGQGAGARKTINVNSVIAK